MEIQFRQAEPADAPQAVPLIYSSGQLEFDYIFATKIIGTLDFLNAAFLEGTSTLGYKNHTVAVVDDRIVGIGAFYSGVEFKSLNRAAIRQIIRFYGLVRCWGVLKRGFDMSKHLSPPNKDTEQIAHLAVAQDMQGKGVGTALLKQQIEVARAKNRRVCALYVAVTNPRAEKLYKRLGFEVVAERKWPIIGSDIAVPDERRMELVLE